LPEASRVEEEILNKYTHATVTLIEGERGIFDVTLASKILFSKYNEGRFPFSMEIAKRIDHLISQ